MTRSSLVDSSPHLPGISSVTGVRAADASSRRGRLVGLLQRKLFAGTSPTLKLLGRVLLHAALVGAAVGFAGLLFVEGLELTQHFVLERLAGYVPLRAAGEQPALDDHTSPFRPWILWLLPAIGALAGGLLSSLAPETRGGGTDAIIGAFHNSAGVVRRRVPFVKMLASITTLGFGGSGGREGPTMQIGGSIGSLVGRYLRVTDRERRILLVAGTAAGMAAVFRTPLGAAILAVEILHRDDIESEALVPAVLASVVSYSVFISFTGESTLFAHAAKYAFIPSQLPLYVVMALVISGVAASFLWTLHKVRDLSGRSRAPDWLKPAIGGLLLGLVATPAVYFLGAHLGEGQGLGILGGGYGAAQVAILGANWLPQGWRGVELLVLLGVVKLIATSLTVGSGGSAGDFGPSMVLGGLFGGAFGHAAQIVFPHAHVDPGAFALVGMGTFYGGLAHVPLGSLVMTCELAGSYDLLVPLMLAEGIALVALRNRSLYHAQVATMRDSAAHRDDLIFDILKGVRVTEVVVRDRPWVAFERNTSAVDVIRRVAGSEGQDAFPVLGKDGLLLGVISADILRTTVTEPELRTFALADDMMSPPLFAREDEELNAALERMLINSVRELIVTDESGRVVGLVDEAEITAVYLSVTGQARRG